MLTAATPNAHRELLGRESKGEGSGMNGPGCERGWNRQRKPAHGMIADPVRAGDYTVYGYHWFVSM